MGPYAAENAVRPQNPASPEGAANAEAQTSAEGPASRPECPMPWFGSEAQRTLPQRLASAPRRILLLDYDGTLAPFHADKMQALPYPGVVPLLEALHAAPAVRLVLVTGRRAADLEHLIELARHVEIWGSHGREHISAAREYTFYPPTTEQLNALDALQQAIQASLAGVPLHLEATDLSIDSHAAHDSLSTPGTSTPGTSPLHPLESPEPLERKPASVAIHWRGLTAESRARLQRSAEEAYRQHGHTSPHAQYPLTQDGASGDPASQPPATPPHPLLERLPFESGVEFRAPGYSKAFAVQRILHQTHPDDAIAYLGDDLTDEDAFAALNGRGLSLLVRPELRTSGAHFWLRPPAELLRFLEEWNQ